MRYLVLFFGSCFSVVVGTWCFRRLSASVILAGIADDAVSVFSRLFFNGNWYPSVFFDHQGWPATGAVKLEGIQMRYRPGLDLVLKGVTLNIKVRSGRRGSRFCGFGVRVLRSCCLHLSHIDYQVYTQVKKNRHTTLVLSHRQSGVYRHHAKTNLNKTCF